MILIGVDPGLATGISVIQVAEDKAPTTLWANVIDYANPRARSVGRTLHELVEGTFSHFGYSTVDDDIQLVIEKFVPEARKVNTVSLEVIGEIRQSIRDCDPWTDHITGWYWQSRQEKDSVHSDVLRRLGLWVKGHDNRHINDATKHVVRRLVAMKHGHTLELGWPE